MATETRTYLFKNGAESALASSILVGATSISLTDASGFPSPETDEIFAIVLRDDAQGWYEVMYCTGRSGNTLTVERGKEDSTAQAWSAGTIVRHAATLGFFQKLTGLDPRNYLTSRPYPYEFIEGITIGGSEVGDSPNYMSPVEGIDLTPGAQGGELRSVLQAYGNYAVEGIDLTPGVQAAGDGLKTVLVSYGNYAVEGIDLTPGVQAAGDGLKTVLVAYTRYAAEGVDLTPSIQSGALT